MARGDKKETVEAVEVESPQPEATPEAAAPLEQSAPAEPEAAAEVEGAAVGEDGVPVLAEVKSAPAEPEAEDGDVIATVIHQISGLRNGEPWPAAGEPITLPAAEAAQYAAAGYVRL